jgi:hypothetical protein
MRRNKRQQQVPTLEGAARTRPFCSFEQISAYGVTFRFRRFHPNAWARPLSAITLRVLLARLTVLCSQRRAMLMMMKPV